MACRSGVSWLYKLDESYSWDSHHQIPADLILRDAKGRVRLVMEASGRIAITPGYAWNGCSPKFCVFDLLLGTPEGVVHAVQQKPKTYYASLVHDALYQFLTDGAPVKRHHADAFFRQLLQEADFGPAWVYWLAVRAFGGVARFLTRVKRQWSGSAQPLAELMPPDRI